MEEEEKIEEEEEVPPPQAPSHFPLKLYFPLCTFPFVLSHLFFPCSLSSGNL